MARILEAAWLGEPNLTLLRASGQGQTAADLDLEPVGVYEGGGTGSGVGGDGKPGTAWALLWAWPGGIEHGPDDLASVGCGQSPKSAGEVGDDGEPSPVQVQLGVPLTLQAR